MMKTAGRLVSSLVIIMACHSFTQREFKPLSFLTEYDSIVFIRSQNFEIKQIDTIVRAQILKLSEINFDSKDFEVEKYGVTPHKTINLFHNGERVALISIWHINKKRIVLNINHLKLTSFYYGYVIANEKFESAIDFGG